MKKIFTTASALLGIVAFAQHEGKVGINTQTPAATLNVKSRTGTDGTTSNLQLQNANNNILMKVLDNGNVGINTTTPISKLHINGETRVENGEIISTNDNAIRLVRGNKGIFFRNDGDIFWMLMSETNNGFGNYNNARPLSYNFSNRNLVFNTQVTDGNVGIGTGNPQAKLDVVGKVKITDGTEQAGRVLTSDANGLASWQSISIGNKTAQVTLSSDNIIVTAVDSSSDAITDNFTPEVYDFQQLESDEIGITADNNGINLPKGKYIIYQSHDFRGAEYCHIQVKRASDNGILYRTFYEGWLNTSYMINLSQNDGIRFSIKCFVGDRNPNNNYYMTSRYYQNGLKLDNKLSILKLN